jgi:GNAT superfamily N-acetyltransferase
MGRRANAGRRKAPDDQAQTVLIIRPCTRRDWPVVARLFGSNGACGGCWCMWPRLPRGGKLWEQSKGPRNRNSFRRLLQAGKVHAVIAFADDEPVGWCSFGPRSSFPRLERVKALHRDWSDGTWSIVCFFIRSQWRGRGVATQLLHAATAEAFAAGAKEIEGYPVLPNKPAAPMSAAFAWMGVPALFRTAGYSKLPRPGASRPIYIQHRRANTA